MTEERKLTDIILTIESDIKELKSYFRNNDLQNRLLLERLQAVLAKFSAPTLTSTPVPKIEVSASEMKPSASSQTSARPTSGLDKDPDIKEKIRRAMAAAQDKTEEVKPLTICQKILGSDAKPVFMAKVDIFDASSHELIKSTKTNQTGKWLTQLLPGNYVLEVSKAATQNKAEIKVEYEIVVPNESSAPILELESKKVG